MESKKRRSIQKMSNKEIRQVAKARALMMSWVAYLDEESVDDQAKYLANSLKGIDAIDKEMIRREMSIPCD